MRILFAKIVSFLFGFFHDKLNVNIRGLGFALRSIKKDAIISIDGKKMFLDSKIPLSYARLVSGDWAEPETHIFLNNILAHHQNVIFFDVGANVGEMVLSTGNNSNLERLYAFEPDPTCANVIRINNILNLIEACEVHQIALSDSKGMMILQGAGTPQAQLISQTNKLDKSLVHISVDTLDNFIQDLDYTFSNDNSFILLIDVEGHEPNVLRGAVNFIESFSPIIIFEYNNTSKDFFNLDDISNILPNNYEIMRLNKKGFLDNDLSKTWNCVALNPLLDSHRIIKNISKQ